jgi:hypothetical protein
MSNQQSVGLLDFLIWLLLGGVTLGLYTLWWTFSRAEAVYRTVGADREGPGMPG